MTPTITLYLIGNPGTGKYTIAQALAKFGFIVCDNQLINNPIFTLLNYDGFSNIPEIGSEHLKRLTEPSRRARWKSIDPQHVYQTEPLITIQHPHLFELDISHFSAPQVAEKILVFVRQLESGFSGSQDKHALDD